MMPIRLEKKFDNSIMVNGLPCHACIKQDLRRDFEAKGGQKANPTNKEALTEELG